MSAAIDLRTYRSDHLDVDFSTVRRVRDIESPVEEWSVEVRAEDQLGIPLILARASVHLIPYALLRDDVCELLRASHQSLGPLASDLAGTGTEIPFALFGEGTGLLVVRTVNVELSYRGHRLGQLIVEAAQSFLLRDGHGLTVLSGYPEECGSEPTTGIEAYWARSGFLPYRGFLVRNT